MSALLAAAFLFLKTGEKFATQATAGPTVAAFTSYVSEKTGGEKMEPQVMNNPKKALEFVTAKKPVLGIVMPAFFIAYEKMFGMEALLETHRQGVTEERYVVVVKKGAPDDLHGKVIATTLAEEEVYVTGVVLAGKCGEEVRLKPVEDCEGAVFDVAEGAKNASDAVLMEEGAWKVFEKDEDLGPKLKVAYRSEELPRNLVVLFRPNAGSVDVEKVKAALKGMSGSEDGKKVLGSIRVESFADVNQEQLSKASRLFHGK